MPFLAPGSLGVVVPPIAAGAVAVEAEHALRRRRPAPGRGGGSAGTRAAHVGCAVRRGVDAHACLESAGQEKQREEGAP